ncbi:MAG: glycosyltransferase family 4 protein [Patescibacteria group bacterium]
MKKITISTYGKFDLFRWAEGFEKRGLLYRVLTDFYSPKMPFLEWRRKDAEKIPKEKVRLFFLARIFDIVARRLIKDFSYYEQVFFDAWASKHIGSSDIVITRSMCALKTMEAAKRMGAKTVMYRGSSHIEFQKEEREREYRKLGITSRSLNSPNKIKRELEEYELCDVLFTPSSFAAKTYAERGVPEEKIIHFPLSAAEDLVISGAGISEKNKNGPLEVLYVGSLSIMKGALYLLEAIKKIKKESGDNVRLTVVGPVDPEIKKFLGKYDGIFEYAGAVRHHLLGEYYQKSSVFVFPTLDDGFGQVMFEAMSHGLPVIATTHSGGPDIIEEGVNGFIIPPYNSEALAEKLLYCAKNMALIGQMGVQAAGTVKEYSVDKFTDRWMDFFEKENWLG